MRTAQPLAWPLPAAGAFLRIALVASCRHDRTTAPAPDRATPARIHTMRPTPPAPSLAPALVPGIGTGGLEPAGCADPQTTPARRPTRARRALGRRGATR